MIRCQKVRQLTVKRDSATVQTLPEFAFDDSDQPGRLLHAQAGHVDVA
jgi:hypothetical protein